MSRLVQQPELELTLVVPGADDAVDRELLWLHNTELPDPSPYLRPGELVLTNGMWLEGTGPESFVEAVLRAEGAGIVLGLREESPETPPGLIAACRRAGLPLAELSVAVPFTALTRAAAAILAEARLGELTGAVRRGGALASALSRGAGAAGILQVVRREHDLPLVVVDRTARQLAVGGAELTEEQSRAAADALARRPPPLEVDLDGTTASLFLIAAVGEVDGALLCVRPYRDLSQAELDSLQQACSYLSLELARQQAVQAIEQRFAGEVLEMAQAGPGREREVAQRLRTFGVDPTGPIAVLAVTVASPTQELAPEAADAVGTFFPDHGLAALVASGTNESVAIVAFPRATMPALRTVAEDLRRSVERACRGERVLIGLGGICGSSSGLRSVLVQARETCRAMLRQAGGPAVQAFDDLDSHRLLLGRLDHETLERFCDRVLGGLREHDRDRGGDLETTLRVFLEADGQYAVTAQRLHVHVNTLRYRLAKLAELTGRDPRSTSGRVDLFLALEADAIR